MAEQVQAVLDSMVTPLRNLMERGVFSEEEIKAIVARRRNSEFLLRRRSVRKADYLRYLQDELQLEQLRELRMKNISKNNESDKHIVQHLHFIYSRSIQTFRNDVSLYLQYIEFCKSTSSQKTLGRIYAQALQVHVRNIGLWIEAASHEYFHEGSVENARILLQRALRVNPKCQQLWLQYFSLELHHVQKLKGRREILQLEAQENDNDSPLDIPMVVYKNAIQAIGDKVVFRLAFLDQCRSFPNTDQVKDGIMETIARDFQHDAQAWIARAAYSVQKKKKNQEAVGFIVDEEQQEEEHVSKRLKTSESLNSKHSVVLTVLEEAVEALPTAEMHVKSIQFLRSYMEQQQQDDDEEEIKLFIHKLLIQAKDKEISSTELTLQEADVLVQEGKLEAATETLKDYATSCKQMAVQVWLQWAKLCGAQASDANMSASRVLKMALDRIPLHSKEQMVLLLELFGALLVEASTGDDCNKSELAQLFERLLLLSAGTDTAPFHNDEAVFGINSVAAACLQYLRFCMSHNSGSMDAARQVYEQVLYRSNYGTDTNKTVAELRAMKELVDEAIKLEKKEISSTNTRKQRLARIYAAAVKLTNATSSSLAHSYRTKRDSDVRYS